MASSPIPQCNPRSPELRPPHLAPQRRCIFPNVAAAATHRDVEGTEYFVKVRGATPNNVAPATSASTGTPTQAPPIKTQQQQQQQQQEKPDHIRKKTHSDPDTFAVFTAAEGSTFGKSDSYTFLQDLGDDDITNEIPLATQQLEDAAAVAELESLGFEYSDDEEDDNLMDVTTDDRPLNDREIVQLSHPLASLTNS